MRRVTTQEYARFKKIAARDFEAALRLLLARDMIYHRNITPEAVAENMRVQKTWLHSLLSGVAWFRMSVVKHDEWLDKVEDSITKLTEDQGGVYGNCKCDPRSLEGVREVLSHST